MCGVVSVDGSLGFNLRRGLVRDESGSFRHNVRWPNDDEPQELHK